MSLEFKILDVGPPREWASKRGDRFFSYDLRLEGVEDDVEWSRRPDSDPPRPGDLTPPSTIEPGPHGKKLKVDWDAVKERKEGSGSSSVAPRQSKRDWQPEAQRDPERSARILRQHSQSAAIEILKILLEETRPHKAPGLQDAQAMKGLIQEWTDWFDADVNHAGQAAVQASGEAPRRTEGASPPTAPSPPSGQRPTGDQHQYLMKLLEDGALDSPGAFALANFMVERFNPEQMKRAEGGLRDLSTQQDTLSKLRIAFEKVTASLLPVPSDDPDLPF